MTYWLSIQYPVELGKPLRSSDNYVWIKEMQRNTCKELMKDGDKVAVYERSWRRGNKIRKGANGEETAQLEEGRMCIRAIVQVYGVFVKARTPYYYQDVNNPRGLDNRYRYIGLFKTKPIATRRDIVRLAEIKHDWRSVFDKQFNPRINGGLRKLSRSEWGVIDRLFSTTKK